MWRSISFAQRSTPGLNFHVNFCDVGKREFDSTEEYMQHKQTYRQKIQISSSLINGCDTRFLINLCFLAVVDRKRKEHYMALTGSDVHMKLSSCLVVCYCLEAHVTPCVAEKSSFHSGSKLSWLYNNLVKKMDQNQSTKACFVCFCSVMFFFLILGIVFDSFLLNVSVIRRVFFGWLHATLQGRNCLVPASVP